MSGSMLLIPVLVPALLALLVFLVSKKDKWVKETLTAIAVTVNLAAAIAFYGQKLDFNMPWGGFGIDFSLRLYHFSSVILLAVAGFAFLNIFYTFVFMKGRSSSKLFYAYLLITLAMVNGAVLANNLVVMLFFWEGMLATIFGLIMTGGKGAFPTAVKALVLGGLGDLCLMLGIGMTGFLAKTLTMDKIHLPVDFWGSFAFILLLIGAIAKAGSMPFHSWIPDAAVDAPLPFMALIQTVLEKALGIYFLVRISMDLFDLKPHTSLSMLMMTIGAVTVILAVAMALVQKDYKRMLSYQSISQVGYMLLGIGSALPVGIVGGVFHLINHAMYKSGLFLTAGAVERQAGTTDMKKLGGLGAKMPITFTCFIVTAAAISGVPPFSGFFSKELIFDGVLESGVGFYIVAVVGVFLTAASVLKLGHAVYLGKPGKDAHTVSEAPWPMLIPMIIIAAGCLLFGAWNALPLNNLIQPILGERLEGHSYAGFPHNLMLVGISVGVLVLAFLNHLYGSRKAKSGLGAADHIRNAPGLKAVYSWAELRYFDPYDIGMHIINGAAKLLWWVDRGVDWIYTGFTVGLVKALSAGIRKAHTGNQSMYIAWVLVGLAVIAAVVAGTV